MGAVKALINDPLATNGSSYRRVFFLTTSSLRHESDIFQAASGPEADPEADLMKVLVCAPCSPAGSVFVALAGLSLKVGGGKASSVRFLCSCKMFNITTI